MIPNVELSLECSRRFRFSAARLYRAWTTPTELVRWWSPGDAGFQVDAQLDVRVGGQYRITMARPAVASPLVLVGEYDVVTPPSLLGFTWRWEHHPKEKTTRVRVSFVDLAEGGCELTIRHSGFPDVNMRDQHGAGWSRALDAIGNLPDAD